MALQVSRLRVHGSSVVSGGLRPRGILLPASPRQGQLGLPSPVDIVRHRLSAEELVRYFPPPARPAPDPDPMPVAVVVPQAGDEPLPLPTTDLPAWGIQLLEAVADTGPADQLYDLIALLIANDGQLPAPRLAATLSIPVPEVHALVAGIGAVVNRGTFPLLAWAADRETVCMNREALAEQFEVNVKRFRVFRPGGRSVVFELPFEPSANERKALEHLARYQRLSEAELSRLCGTRRIGGLMQLLLDKLGRYGWHAVSEEAAGDQGRIYVFRDERLAP